MLTQSEARLIADDMLAIGNFYLERASWNFYEYVLEQRDRSHCHARITYSRGKMEVLTGADVQRAFGNTLPQILMHFDFLNGLTAEDICAQPHDKDGRDYYHIVSELVLDKGTHANVAALKPGGIVVEITIKRTRLNDDSSFLATAPQLQHAQSLGGLKIAGVNTNQLFKFFMPTPPEKSK